MVVLPDHVNGVAEAGTYQALFRYNVRKLIETAKEAGVEPRAAGASAAEPARPAGGPTPAAASRLPSRRRPSNTPRP